MEKTDEWGRHFGYELKIDTLEEASERFGQTEKLRGGEFVFANDDDSGFLIRRFKDSDYAIVLALEETDREETSRAASGTLFLLKDYFARFPEAEWPVQLSKLQAAFDFPLELTTREELATSEEHSLDQERLSEIDRLGYTWVDMDNDSSIFYVAMGNPRTVLIAGPTFPTSNILFILITTLVVTMLLVISLALLSWLFPLWRDLKKLDLTAQEFGTGHLERRVDIRKSSIVSRLALSFNSMANSIQKLIRSHQQLTNAVAHDLRTPLARLRFAVEMLESEECTDEERVRYRKSVNNSIGVLEDLIDHLLVYSRYSRQADINHFSHTDLSALIREEVEMREEENGGLRCEFVCDESMKQRTVWADPRAVTRALDNMLSNACRYARARIQVSLHQRAGNCYLRVEDDGHGIPEADRERILQPFAQLNNPERGSSSGHGLGLAIVSQIAQWHGGRLRIFDSSLGGAGFEVSWPLSP
ncbi:ATP-binding protein [Hahella sp. CCB-MM4]|uniref:ATP-binding protein n=1 Tax=Hahella sp. (strain CCB-MM4) TaxID=1926491 RepID=UPI001FEE31DB|nr:ATP-binding protein [Hahella sp. CCB-MM4]